MQKSEREGGVGMGGGGVLGMVGVERWLLPGDGRGRSAGWGGEGTYEGAAP